MENNLPKIARCIFSIFLNQVYRQSNKKHNEVFVDKTRKEKISMKIIRNVKKVQIQKINSR